MGEGFLVRCFTAAKKRPTEIGSMPGAVWPIQVTLTQLSVGAVGLVLCLAMLSVGAPFWTVLPVVLLTIVVARATRKVRIDDRPFLAGVAGWIRFVFGRASEDRLVPRTADAVVGNVVVGSDHSQWLLFSVQPAAYGALIGVPGRLGSLQAVQQMVSSVGASRWRLFSTVDSVTADEVVGKMAATSRAPTWEREMAAEHDRLSGIQLTDRRFWLMILAGEASPGMSEGGWLTSLASMAGWRPPARASWVDVDALADQSRAVINRAGAGVKLRPATQAEARRLLDRIPAGVAHRPPPKAELDSPHLRLSPEPDGVTVGRGVVEGASAWRAGDAQWSEPLQRFAVAKSPTQTVMHTAAVVSQLPDSWTVPGGGEVLWALDALAEPWEWLMDVEVIPNQIATTRARNLDRRIKNQYREYEGDPSGAPPELDAAKQQSEAQRQALVSTRSDEYVATILFTTAQEANGDDDASIEAAAGVLQDRLNRLVGLAAEVEMTVVAPSGDQLSARRLWLPRKHRAPISRDYRQYVLSDGVAGVGPCLQSRVGDPQGALLGWADDQGTQVPVLFDPTLGPRGGTVGAEGRSPCIGITGVPGKGKSVVTKRIMWTTLMAGGVSVVVDRSEKGEYVEYAEAVRAGAPELRVEIIDVTDPKSLSLDPMRAIPNDRLAADTATLLLCYLGQINPHSAAAARLALVASDNPTAPIGEVARIAAEGTDKAAADLEGVKELSAVLARHPMGGALFDPDREPADLTADLVVLWAPGLSLSADPDTPGEVAESAVVLGTMLAGRAITFADPDRFAGMVLDEAWSLFADRRARSVVTEGMRDGRKHNAAIWITTQSPSDFAASPELSEMLGYVACFGQENEEAAAAGSRLAGIDPARGVPLLMGLDKGIMLWRDVFGRVGLVEVALPADPGAAAAIDTTPPDQRDQAASGLAVVSG